MPENYPKLFTRCHLLAMVFSLAVLLNNSLICHAQKYSFSHQDIEDGLVESQVNNLTIDNQHRLWIATNGGACRYDGQEYTAYTRQNGMPSNFVSTVFTEKNGRVWFGTQNGLTYLDNHKLVDYLVIAKLKNKRVTSIVKDSTGNVWFLMNHHLFGIKGKKIKQELIPDTGEMLSSCLAVNKAGKLFAAVYRKGIYRLDNGNWVRMIAFPFADKRLIIEKILFDKQDEGNLFLLTGDTVYTLKNNRLRLYEPRLVRSIKKPLLAIEQENNGAMWIGSVSGAYRVKQSQLMHFDAHNGFTDNPISEIYLDADNNLWLGSQGSGFYKYEGDRVVVFDKSQGMPVSEIVMSMVKEKDNQVLIALDGGGLMRYDGKKLLPVKLPENIPGLNRVQCLLTDKNGIIWIGTNAAGIWTYHDNSFAMVPQSNKYSINDLKEDEQGNIWVASPSGCMYVKDNQLHRLDDFNMYCSSVCVVGKDSVMVGTQDGVMLSVNKKKSGNFKLDAVRTSAVFCMLQYKHLLLMGTDDRGLFVWDKASGQVKNYSIKDGLNSNTIYSLVTDDHDVVWIGNGRGVNKMAYNENTKRFIVNQNENSKSPILEANQDASLYFDHKVWIGTTKGLVIYNTDTPMATSSQPHIVIKSVKLIARAKNGVQTVDITGTKGIKLSHNQSHISISFQGIYLRNPEGVSYRYQLAGLDTSWSLPGKNNVVDYPSLPAGNYTFKVKAINADAQASADTASFSFAVLPPFYQTLGFRLLSVSFFILVGVGTQRYFHHRKIKQLQVIEATKREESMKIRQQTAEDFHDELGNKLTRITVLSQLLDNKMSDSQPDQKKLLEQIRQNAASLYSGTKDILWALDPQSDNLYEILNRIKDFGTELFLDTGVRFEFNGIDEQLNEIKLPMEYSRNLPMIFKELLNNILKHANANQVTVNLNNSEKDKLVLSVSDNGQGFDPETVRKGQGINNIRTRTQRIGGTIDIYSAPGKGSLSTINIKLNSKKTGYGKP